MTQLATPLPLPVPRSGIASVTTLRPPAAPTVGIAPLQGELALALDHASDLPRVAPLVVVPSDDRDLDAFATRLAQGIVEVIGGDRGVHQLMRWTTDEVYEDLLRRTRLMHRTGAPEQRIRRVRAQVRSVHLFRPTPDAAELSVHVRHGARSRAIAGRIERIEGRWRCSVLQFG